MAPAGSTRRTGGSFCFLLSVGRAEAQREIFCVFSFLADSYSEQLGDLNGFIYSLLTYILIHFYGINVGKYMQILP